MRGTPDFLCCINGCFVALELKTEDGTLEELQRYKLKQISESGGVGIVVSPENWGTTYEFLHCIALYGYEIAQELFN